MISCKDYVEATKVELNQRMIDLQISQPVLTVVSIGDDDASAAYIRGKKRDCEELGFEFNCLHIPKENVEDMEQTEIETLVSYYNDYSTGIIVQLPIPDKYDLNGLLSCIDPEKDLDGFKSNSRYQPCTPLGIINWLKYNQVELRGKNCVVIGRSDIVGKPLVKMLIEEGATVTCCNSKTKDIKFFTKNADIIVTAIGKAKHFDASYFGDNQIIVDVGINRDENGKLCGDVDRENIHYDNTYITPVPGGVGLLTRITLMENLTNAAAIQHMNDC